jgi:hypothetical protein
MLVHQRVPGFFYLVFEWMPTKQPTAATIIPGTSKKRLVSLFLLAERRALPMLRHGNSWGFMGLFFGVSGSYLIKMINNRIGGTMPKKFGKVWSILQYRL